MRSKISLIFVFLLAVTIEAPRAFGQQTSVFVSPIPNVPFMAIVNAQRSQILPDGTTRNLKSIHAIARDSQGQIFNDARTWVPSTSNDSPVILMMHMYDPQTRLNTLLYPKQHIAVQKTLLQPPSTEPPVLFATPAANSAPVNQLVKEEDLGTRTMEGVPAHGVRETQTIAADDSGTGNEVQVVDEYWYSEDLRIDMLIKHSDPRSGDLIRTVTHVSRTDPDPVIFTVPSDYKVIGRRAPSTAQKTN